MRNRAVNGQTYFTVLTAKSVVRVKAWDKEDAKAIVSQKYDIPIGKLLNVYRDGDSE